MPPAEFQFMQIEKFLKAIGPALRTRILPAHMLVLSKRFTTEVKIRYRAMASPPRGMGLTVLQRGKEFGPMSRRPAKRPVSDIGPLFVRLAKAVQTTRLSPLQFRVGIDPMARFPQGTLRFPRGVPLQFLAWVHENRKGAIVPVTNLMLSYTIMMREGRGGYGTRRRTAASRRNRIKTRSVKGRIAMFPPNRPVWSYVIAQRLPMLLERFGKAVQKDLMEMAIAHGGRPRG